MHTLAKWSATMTLTCDLSELSTLYRVQLAWVDCVSVRATRRRGEGLIPGVKSEGPKGMGRATPPLSRLLYPSSIPPDLRRCF